MSRQLPTPEQIDAVLPQTQCGLCHYPGCMPYAKAIVEDNAAIDLCLPGGVPGLKKIAELMNENPLPLIPNMEKKAKPPLLAVIREAECIGCTKCIQACPVDAILGSAKHMHTIIADVCTGCELCIAPCPVDCIDLVAITEKSTEQKQQQADIARKRFHQHQARREKQAQAKIPSTHITPSLSDKKEFIQAAILRAKARKQS